MWKILVAAVLLSACQIAAACQCGFFSAETASKAQVAFVFQVLSTRFYPARPDDPNDDGAVANIRIVRVLRGKPVATHISYPVGWCCGLAMATGRYYVAFLPANSRSFGADFSNVLALSPLYQGGAELPPGIELILQGKPAPERILEQSQALLSPSPAPPCPPRARKLGR